MFSVRIATLLAAALVASTVSASFAADPQYKKIKDITIGGAGGFDYLNADADNQRLYVAHGTKVEVIDTKEDKKIGEILNTPGVHGVAIANDLNRAFTSNGQGNAVSVIDLTSKDEAAKPTFKLVTDLAPGVTNPIKTGNNPDAIMFDAKSGEVWTCNGRANTFTAFDATTGKIVASLPCGNGVDAAAYDPSTHLAFVSAGGSGTVTIAKVEADKLTLVQTLTTERGARTMTVDTKTHKIYLCNNPAAGFKVLVYGFDAPAAAPATSPAPK